ncbi:MAG: hypothetical protein A3F72_04765 [Bacteroidetes bacterium RIFCSPLOWO2_12_FULL_35_15]|nr:MAG: hypothetical protein A3F72_04765 [Bacteroidetes bacterium RIFCSPLOWO2_12_FULL_35_15]
MKKKSFLIISSLIILFFCSFKHNLKFIQINTAKAPIITTNHFKTTLKEGDVINCRKISDLGVIMFFDEQMKKQEIFQIELHRYGNKEDILVAYKSFIPSGKEFQKKYSKSDSLKLKLLTPEDQFNTSDFQINTLLFKTSNVVNDMVCTLKDKKHYNFYLVVKGYYKTGKKNNFGDDLYDTGKELSLRSITFKNWENKTQ